MFWDTENGRNRNICGRTPRTLSGKRTIERGISVRLFIADADSDVRLGVQMLVNQQPGMNVVGIATRSDGMVQQITATKPDVLLLNWDLPGQHVAERMAHLRSLMPRLKVVVLSVRPDARSPALAAGADAFVNMGMPPDELLNALRDVGFASMA